MKKALLLLCVMLAFQVQKVVASDIRAEFSFARFATPESGTYLETYILLKGHSLAVVQNPDGSHFSEVAIIMKISNDNGVAFQDAYRVKGPVITGNLVSDFIDQQRIPLRDGNYEIDLTIHDANTPEAQPARVMQSVTINYRNLAVNISDIQLVGSFEKTTEMNMLSKAGYDLVPKTSNFYPQIIEDLTFYFEVYNTDRKIGEEKEFLLNIFIENADNGSLAGDLRKYFKRTGATVIPVLHTFPIGHISSGNYNIVVEVRNRTNELLDSKRFFIQRSNTLIDELASETDTSAYAAASLTDLSGTFVGQYNRPEELKEYVRCLSPLATQEELVRINRRINYNDPVMMKQFIYNFWTGRHGKNAEAEWLKYLAEVKKVNANYSTNLTKGYDTDRGRVYLQYGPPNAIADSYFEPNTYPYEIWHYYRLESPGKATPENNRKFVFANMSPGASEFLLIHSDADNEQQNARWHYDLQKRNEPNRDLDEERGRSHHGSRALQYYNSPR